MGLVVSYLVDVRGSLGGLPQDNTVVIAKMMRVLAAPVVDGASVNALEPGVSKDLFDRSTLDGVDFKDAGHNGAALAGEKLENALFALVTRLGKSLVGWVLVTPGDLPGETADGHAYKDDAQ